MPKRLEMGELWPTPTLFFVTLVVCGLLIHSLAQAEETGPATAQVDEETIQRIKQEVIQELLEEGFLEQQIELGIQSYVKKQREAQQAAKAEQARAQGEKAKRVRRVSADRDHIYGDPDAKISLIEYSDFECPYCKRFHSTAKSLVDAYPGQVNWVYRHFPLSFHNPGAQKQAEASECAYEQGGDEVFWQYTDAVYARTKSGGKGFPLDKLTPLAEELGLDGAAFQDCVDSGRYAARVKEDFDEGREAGITGTPGNILLHNGTGEAKLEAGAQRLQTLKNKVDEMLASSKE